MVYAGIKSELSRRMTARKIILLCLAIIYPNPVKSTSSTEAETEQTTREATTTEDTTMTISSNTVTTNILSSTSPAATTTPTVTILQSTSTILSSTSEVTTKISTAMDLTSSTREPTTIEDITETSTTSPLETMTSVTTATGTFSTSAYSTSSDTSHMTSDPSVTSHMTSDPSDTSHMTSDLSVTSTGTETSLSSSASSSSAGSTNFLYTTTAFETTTSSPPTISEDTTMTSALTTTALEITSAPTTTTEETTTTSAPTTTTEETTTTSAPQTTTEETTKTSAPITATEETTTSTNITTAEETTTTSTHTTTAVTSTTNVYFITVKPTVALSFSTKYNDTRFNETLYVTSSLYFKEISKVYKEKLTSVYNKSSGFHSLEITNFKRGSLIVEYKTKYEVRGINETILERDLNSIVFETLRNETDVDEEYLNTSFISDIEKAKVQFRVAAGQDPCQLDSVKEQCAGFPICNSSADSTVTCSSPCLYLDCGSHGTCILNAHNISKAQCSCGEDDRYIYGGERCHQRAEKLSLKSEHIIAIAGGVGGGLILILLIALISTCCYQRNQNKKKEMDFLPMTLFNEDDVTSMQNHASKQDDGLKSRLKDGKDDRLDTFGSHENPAMSGRENHSAVKTLESLDTSKNVQTTDGGGKHYAAADHSYYTIADKESEMTPVYQPLGKHQFKESDVAQPPDQPRYSDEKAKPSYMSSNAWTARQAGPTSSDFSRSSSRHADEARARDVHQPAGKRNLSTPYATQPHNPPPVDYDDDSPKSNFTHVYDYIPVERISIRRPQLLK